MIRSLLTGPALAAVLVVPLATAPLAASAQTYGPGVVQNRHNIIGRVTAFSGYDLQLNDGRSVRLHRGTVINPTGWSIRPGQRVAITESWIRGQFQADRIDVLRRR